MATLPAGPLSDWPVKVWTRLTRSESSRPRVIGWSPRRLFSRVKTRRVALPSEFAGSEVAPLLMSTPNRFARHSAAEPNGAWSVISRSAAAGLDPVADGVALGVGERGVRRVGLAHPLGPQRVGDDQDVALGQELPR